LIGMKRLLDFRSLPVQLILSFVGVVFLTTAIAGVPAIWIIRGQLGRQAWSQLSQGARAALSLYIATQNEVASFATLTAERPTLHKLLNQGKGSELVNYLFTLQTGTGQDLLAVCDANNEILAITVDPAPDDFCRAWQASGYHLDDEREISEIWFSTSRPVSSLNGDSWIVIAGRRLGADFARRMGIETGLEHILRFAGNPIVSSSVSSQSALADITFEPSNGGESGEMLRATFSLQGQPYYATLLRLDESSLDVILALPIADIVRTQQRLAWVLAGSSLGVAVFGSVLGILLARRISSPLTRMADTANRFSMGDLSTPIAVDGPVREVAQVSLALERARADLLTTLTDLSQERDWINHLLESIVEGILTLDGQMQITFFSQGAERITGWNKERVLNRDCDEIFRLTDTTAPFSQLIPGPGTQNRLNVELAGGYSATLAFSRSRLAPREAGEAGIILVFRDVSEEESIRRLLGQFLANISHEFRTPLSSLAASVELLLDQAPDLNPAETEELLKSLHLGILGLQTLIDNLLESTSIETGHFRVFPRSYDLGMILSEAVATMQPLIEKYGQRLAVELPMSIPLVKADSRRTVQVLINLLSNASKYGPADAEINVRADSIDDLVKISVEDRGPGIPSKYRKIIFQRFVYPTTNGASSKVGAGLGLSVVKAVVEAQGGQVGVDDRPGGGSIFWFTLPTVND
jgi:PAS domain S-box-containing protein